MPKSKKLKMAVINITTEPPHSPKRYVELFKFLLEHPQEQLKIAGHDYISLEYMKYEDAIFKGTFARFTTLDTETAWWDNSKRKALVDDDGLPLPFNFDRNLSPNYKKIIFFFSPEKHKFIVNVKHISPHQAERALQKLLNSDEIIKKFGPISVNIVPENDAIDKLIDLPNKYFIETIFTIPNGDSFSEFADEFNARVEAMGANTVQQSYKAIKGDSLKPDDELKALMKISAENGSATVKYKDNNGRINKKSTKNYPRIDEAEYTGDETGNEYINAIYSVISKILGWTH